MKKYLIFLIFTICFANLSFKSQAVENDQINWPANKDILNYGCIKGDLYCFCQRNSDNSIYTIGFDNTCGGSKYNNRNISYGEFLELGGLPQHCYGSCTSSSEKWGKDISFEIKVLKKNYIKFESKFLTTKNNEVTKSNTSQNIDQSQEIYEFQNPNKNSTLSKNKKVFACKAVNGHVYLLLAHMRSKCSAGAIKISKQEYFAIEMKYCQTDSWRCNNVGRSLLQSQNNSEPVSQETEVVQTEVVQIKLDKKSLKEELQYWKELFEDELITQAEYDAKRKELLSGSSVTSTTRVAEPKVEKKKIVEQTTVVENNTNTIDLSFKDKNYINQSLLDKMSFFSNDGKIKDYCENKYPKLHVYMECYAQNVKKYRNYKRAAAVYDLYIDYGRYLAWEAMIGNMSESSARYQLSTKRKELGDAYAAESRDKWNRIADSIEQLRKTHESFQPKPIYGSGESTNVCMYNAEKEAMKICKRKRSNGTCASFSNQGC